MNVFKFCVWGFHVLQEVWARSILHGRDCVARREHFPRSAIAGGNPRYPSFRKTLEGDTSKSCLLLTLLDSITPKTHHKLCETKFSVDLSQKVSQLKPH